MAYALSSRFSRTSLLLAGLTVTLSLFFVPFLTNAGETETAAAPQGGPYVYLLSKPIKSVSYLGWKGQTAHYAAELSWKAMSTLAAWRVSQGNWLGKLYIAFELGKALPVMIGQSMADLEIRDWYKKSRAMENLLQVPGVHTVRVMSAKVSEIRRSLTTRLSTEGFIFLESDRPLIETPLLLGSDPENNGKAKDWGTPMRILSTEQFRVRFNLEIAGKVLPLEWNPTVQDVFSERPMPREVADHWIEQIHGFAKSHSWLKRHFGNYLQKVKMSAALVDPGGGEVDVGPVATGGAVKKVLQIGFFSRLKNAVLWRIPKPGFRLSRKDEADTNQEPFYCRIPYSAILMP